MAAVGEVVGIDVDAREAIVLLAALSRVLSVGHSCAGDSRKSSCESKGSNCSFDVHFHLPNSVRVGGDVIFSPPRGEPNSLTEFRSIQKE